MKRTHSCGDLRESHIGQSVTLNGWLHRRRDHGGLSFFDLRDRSGLAQIVFNAKKNAALHASAKSLGPETVLSITGTVGLRPKGSENPKLPSGMVELTATALEVLNPSVAPPFEIEDVTEATEDVRMDWRYIDLRRPAAQAKIILRHQITQSLRRTFDAHGFLEIETPILTKSTPEGARDYLVPSRVNPGRFYALPQSPQLYKQLLMVSGMERYVQIARCFRDEDLRADRQPEFTQLDFEMSFVDEEDVFRVVEDAIGTVFADVLKVPLTTPFPRMRYAEAQAKHKTDKPDLRTAGQPWAFCWVTEFPMFHWNETTKRWDAEHHPFTAPHPDDVATMAKDPKTVRSRAYDLVLNGTELGSGSIRIHRADVQQQVFSVLGLSEAQVQEQFGFLLKAFAHGAPPHGGFAMGLDRFTALAAGSASIRDVIAFPKTAKAVDPVSGAPSPATDAQLKELGIAVLRTAPAG